MVLWMCTRHTCIRGRFVLPRRVRCLSPLIVKQGRRGSVRHAVASADKRDLDQDVHETMTVQIAEGTRYRQAFEGEDGNKNLKVLLLIYTRCFETPFPPFISLPFCVLFPPYCLSLPALDEMYISLLRTTNALPYTHCSATPITGCL